MNRSKENAKQSERSFICDGGEDICRNSSFSLFCSLIRNIKLQVLWETFRETRNHVASGEFFSIWLFLLAMPVLALVIQCGLFLFGKTCSPFPMWFSFFVFSILSLTIHWKCLLKFWGLVFLALLFTTYTFSYHGWDAEVYHIPMQLLLRNGWNPIFDSTIDKFRVIVDPSIMQAYHTLFLPKTVALCGALVARSTGLWIADSFLGYLLLFVLFRTALVFAKEVYRCKWKCGFIFATIISLSSEYSSIITGLNDFQLYASMMITLFSLLLYLSQHDLHDFILAILSTAICCTIKTTGLINCVAMWGLFGLYSWKRKETYWGLLIVALLVAWIGMSPLITSWIQYGSPLYPSMTFDPKIQTIDLTNDFLGNADGEQMGYIARFVYAWISPVLATKACALYYHKPDFNPDFLVPVTYNANDFGTILNLLFCCSVVLLLLAKKNVVTWACLFILATLFFCPLKYIGYERYFPQVKALVPMCLFQFAFYPPSWLKKRAFLQRLSRFCLCSFLSLICCFFATKALLFHSRSLILEGQRQELLTSFGKDGIAFAIPYNYFNAYTLSQRLTCANIDYTFIQSSFDQEHYTEDVLLPHLREYIVSFKRSRRDHPVSNKPFNLIKFKWLDVFKYFPHPIFYRKPDIPESSIHEKATIKTPEQTI